MGLEKGEKSMWIINFVDFELGRFRVYFGKKIGVAIFLVNVS